LSLPCAPAATPTVVAASRRRARLHIVHARMSASRTSTCIHPQCTRVCANIRAHRRARTHVYTHTLCTHAHASAHTPACADACTRVCVREGVFVCVTGRACRLRPPSSPLSASRAQQVREQCSQPSDTPASGPHLSPCWQVLGHARRRGRESDSVRSLGHMYPHACACMYTHADEGGKKGGQSNTRISTHLH
jgi:hypothetical protein